MKKINRNIKLAYLFESLQSFGSGVWMGNILSLYIVLFSEKANGIFGLTSNELVGVSAGITGIAMTAIVFPAGILADKIRRDIILKFSGILGIMAMLILALSSNIIFIMIALFLWGAFQGFARPAFEAIIADSLPTGNRSGTYSTIHLVRQFSLSAGPILNILLFLLLGDDWNIEILRTVMTIGVSISLISAIVLFFFKDENTIGDESESIIEIDDNTEINKREKWIPILLVMSNVIIGTGAGMTVKFFPVFFRAIYHLKPVSVQLIMAFTFILTGLAGIIAQKLSLRKGRGQAIFFVQISATICLVLIAFYPPLVLLVPLFILRGSLMNAAQPLSRSILMDIVPKRNRGKWNSLETIAWGLFWNASAVIGGFLIGDNNFKRCFLITAGIYVIATIPILIIIPMIRKEIGHKN